MTRTRCVLAYLLITAPMCLACLGRADLIRMEPIIALGARHMRATHEWFVPRLYGEIYAFKPALAYWMVTVSEAAFGVTEFAVRLPSALCAIGCGLLVVVALGSWVCPLAGLIGGLATATSFLFIEQARMAGFDMPLALGLGMAVVAAGHNLQKSKPQARWWLIAYLGLLIAFLAKGLPAIAFFVPGLLLAALATRRLRTLINWRHACGVLLFAVAAAAYIRAAWCEAGPAAFSQHVGEVAFRSSHWSAAAALQSLIRPLMVFALFLPGSALILVAICLRKRQAVEPTTWQVIAISAAFVISGTIMLMLSPDVSSRYFLPLSVPIGLLAGTCGTLFLGAKPMRIALVGGLALAVGYATAFIAVIEPHRSAAKSQRLLAEQWSRHIPAQTTVYMDTQDSHSSLAYYLNRPVRIVNWNAQAPAAEFCFIGSPGQIAELQSRPDINVKIIAEDKSLSLCALQRQESLPAMPGQGH